MASDPYIAIGTRGTSLTRMTALSFPLHEGENPLPSSRGKSRRLYMESHAWVTNEREAKTFRLHRLSTALSEGRVIHVTDIGWTMENGSRHRGEAFFPPEWRAGDSQPALVAVRSSTWGKTTLQLRNPNNTPDDRGTFYFTGNSLTRKSSTETLVPAERKRWTKDELLVALNVYQRLKFGQFDQRNPLVRQVAERMKRTPSSLAMKLSNLASLDPALKLRNIKGLEGASTLDREMWEAFQAQPEELVPQSEVAMRALFGVEEDTELELTPKGGIRVIEAATMTGPTETTAVVKIRRGQRTFRDAVLNNFNFQCGITGLAIPELLDAAHILGWKKHPKFCWDKRNGLCLTRLHHAAFDLHLIAFDEKFRLLLSPRLKPYLSEQCVADNFNAYSGQALQLPDDAVLPELAFLAKHRAVFSQKS